MGERCVEVRGYELHAGERGRFHEIMVAEAVPLARRAGGDIVRFGPGPQDDASYVLVRAYDDLAARAREQEAFYASRAWRAGPREAIVARIARMTSVVVAVDAAVVDGLRRSGPRAVEFAGLEIVAGRRPAFHELYATRCLPLVRAAGIDVLRFGPSPHDDDTFAVVRAFASVAELRRQEDAFYGSRAWVEGPRPEVLALIAQMTFPVVEVDEATVAGLRQG